MTTKRTRNFGRTEDQKQMAAQYNPWKAARKQNILVTREEFVQLWTQSGLWSKRGLGIGCATVHYDTTLTDVKITDCSIVLRTNEMLAASHGREVKPPVQKRTYTRRTEEEKQAQRIGSVQKVKRVRVEKPRKQYVKSEKQMLKELQALASGKKKRAPYVWKKTESELNVAVDMFYDQSNNPLNAKIRELAKLPVTNYEVINLLTGKRAAFRPNKQR